MQEERREQQHFHLSQDSHNTCNSITSGNKDMGVQGTLILNRWQRISSRTRRDTSCVFNNLLHHISVETLKEAFSAMDKNKALGIDKVSKETYGKNLEANLEDLYTKIRNGSYKPQMKREVLIPKANGKTRPIEIACFEDKLVDHVVAKILSAVYEPMFIRNSFGFRPYKSAHNAIEACYYSLKGNKRPFVVEIDFSNFFNTIPHKKLMGIAKKKIADYRFNGLVRRFLKSSTLKSDGSIHKNTCGTPQGGVMSPILANIYLNEVVDQWFLKNYGSYNNIIVRYADDAVFFFKKESDAKEFMLQFEVRVEAFGLSLNRDKTKTINFNKSKENSFDFLGFTLYWGKQNKKRSLKVKTQKEKLHKSFKAFYDWIKANRNRMRLKEIWGIAKSKLQGHYNYFGFWMNRQKLVHFYSEAIRALFKWLNRRSQKRSYSWDSFSKRLEFNPLPTPPRVEKLMKLGKTYGQI
ncbi:MAG: group II intron reverse transcriptase/maturase [Campylobacterota bacterium]|nr:group II intron reverse transcriptase/maturase [Campylobacterota bacterium]